MERWEIASTFYEANYRSLVQCFLKGGEIATLGGTRAHTCRFCGRTSPKVTFRKRAHAFPESTGNKSLLTNYECDTCNSLFGEGIEDHFGKWSAPTRALSQVRGKNGVPTLKKTGGGWRVELGNTGLEIQHYIDEPIVQIDASRKRVTISIPRQPFIPLAVFKTFVKMAISIMPESELAFFQDTIKWIRNRNHSAPFMSSGLILFDTFVPGPLPFSEISAFLFRRKTEALPVPYMTFMIAYGNDCYQIFVPCPPKDRTLPASVSLCHFPTPYDLKPSHYGIPQRAVVELGGREAVKGELAEMTMHFDRVEEILRDAKGPEKP